MGKMNGRVALITGGASGLGAEDARVLAREGATVVITDMNVALGEAVAAEIPGALFLPQDVRDEARWREVVAETVSRFRRLDTLVNNAGLVRFADVETMSYEEFRLQIDVMLGGTFLGCRAAIPLMSRDGSGSIINMASTAALMGYGNIPAYAACKAGIAGMTRSLAVDFQDRGYGIRVNALAPGGIETPMVMGISGRAGQAPMEIPAGPLPADALGHPSDVAGCVLFLASDEARFLNGLTIPVDNGLYARPHH